MSFCELSLQRQTDGQTDRQTLNQDGKLRQQLGRASVDVSVREGFLEEEKAEG